MTSALEPGDRPRDCMQGDGADPFAELATGDEDASGGANMSSGAIRFCVSSGPNASSGSDTISDADTKSHAGAADAAPAPLLVPQRYMIQFTAPQEYVDLLERAKSLSAYESRSLVEIHLRAMSAFVSELEKRRCGATSPRRKSADAPRAEAAFLSEPAESTDLPRQRRQRGADLPFEHEESVDLPLQRGESSEQVRPDGSTNVPLQRGESSEPLERNKTAEAPPPEQRNDADRGADSRRRRSRHVPRAVRRAVWERDEERCTYVDDRGVRCRETACLELDHEVPHARGGLPTVTNLRLRCRTHNQLTAENEFGPEFMDHKKGDGVALHELALSGSLAGVCLSSSESNTSESSHGRRGH